MKVAHGQSLSPASGVYDLWSGTYTVNEFDTSALTIAAGTKTYKSSVVDNWNNHHISAVSIDTSSESLGPKNYISPFLSYIILFPCTCNLKLVLWIIFDLQVLKRNLSVTGSWDRNNFVVVSLHVVFRVS